MNGSVGRLATALADRYGRCDAECQGTESNRRDADFQSPNGVLA